MMKWLIALSLGLIILSAPLSYSKEDPNKAPAEKKKKVIYRKVQKVDFEGADVDGKVRNPSGSYLVQKRGINFFPLYKVKESFDDSIIESLEHLE